MYGQLLFPGVVVKMTDDTSLCVGNVTSGNDDIKNNKFR